MDQNIPFVYIDKKQEITNNFESKRLLYGYLLNIQSRQNLLIYSNFQLLKHFYDLFLTIFINLKQLFKSKLIAFYSLFMEQSLIFYSFIYLMGNTQAQNNTSCTLVPSLIPCRDKQLLTNKSRNKSFTHVSISNELGQLTLADFYGELLISQCFYVLSTLLQQYYLSFKRNGKATVSSALCTINQLGELKIQSDDKAFSLQGSSSTSFVSVLSQILELVQDLAWEQQWASNGQCGYFRQKIIKIIYKYHSDEERLYRQLIGEVFSFMQFNQYRTNLLPAILRKNKAQQPLLKRKKSHQRHQSAIFESFAKKQHQSSIQMSVKTNRQAPLSFMGRNKDKQRSFYHRKMAHTEGEEYYENLKQTQNEKQSTSFHNSTTARITNNRNYISSQYSMNIAALQTESSPNNKAKVKFRKFANQIHYNNDENDRSMKRSNTTNQFFCQQESKHKQTKSLLQDLARSVIVREVPSSKSIIF